jgi:hypothetical protein
MTAVSLIFCQRIILPSTVHILVVEEEELLARLEATSIITTMLMVLRQKWRRLEFEILVFKMGILLKITSSLSQGTVIVPGFLRASKMDLTAHKTITSALLR